VLDTLPHLFPTRFPVVRRGRVETLQVNLGFRCNQSCVHCHVDAGPKRLETMSTDTSQAVIELARRLDVRTLDLTGGAPELHESFRYLVREAWHLGMEVIDRCNLTILSEAGQEDLADFLGEHRVRVVASLPCYLEENVDRQRGGGVFARSVAGLQRLNALGYGMEGTGLTLDLVFNPQGAALPPPEAALEEDYRRELNERYGIRFNRLRCIANMPIKRFGSWLLSRGEFESYLSLLKSAHCDANLERVMCRSLLSVDWRGRVFDCDFNQMLDLPLENKEGGALHIREVTRQLLAGRRVVVGEHCYGCTAGQGSSCGGALG